MGTLRNKVIEIASSQIGKSEAKNEDDVYIKWFGGFALNVAWCCIFVCWVLYQVGILTDVAVKTASCDVMMSWLKKNGRWKNSKHYGGTYTPVKGDMILYSSSYNQSDATHIGFVESVSDGYVNAIEGNKSDAVGRRKISLDDKYILGYGILKYPDEVQKVDTSVNTDYVGTGIGVGVAKASLTVRGGANEKSDKIGILDKNMSVEVISMQNDGWIKVVWKSVSNGYGFIYDRTNELLYITFDDDGEPYTPKEYSNGDVVSFTGNTHYSSAEASQGSSCSPGKAKVSQKAKGSKHPYHLVKVSGSKSTVYGWVDEKYIAGLYSETTYESWEGKVTCSVLNVRTGPGTKYGKLSAWPQLKKNCKVTVTLETKASDGGKWYRVNIYGNVGYVSAQYITKA